MLQTETLELLSTQTFVQAPFAHSGLKLIAKIPLKIKQYTLSLRFFCFKVTKFVVIVFLNIESLFFKTWTLSNFIF